MLRCGNCGKEIREPIKTSRLVGVEWIHKTGMIRCDGISKLRHGYHKAKKAIPGFKQYLDEVEMC